MSDHNERDSTGPIWVIFNLVALAYVTMPVSIGIYKYVL
jgi:hypothetical protein